MIENRAIRRQVRFVDGSTNQKVQCRTPMKFFSDQVSPGFQKSVTIPYSMPALSECPAAFFHDCISISLEELSTICAFLNRAPSKEVLASGACQKPGELGYQPASRTEQIAAMIGPVALFQRRRSSARIGAIFLQTMRTLRLVSTLEPRHIVIHSLFCSILVAICGTRFSLKNPCYRGSSASSGVAHHRTNFQIAAHRADLWWKLTVQRDRKHEQDVCLSS